MGLVGKPDVPRSPICRQAGHRSERVKGPPIWRGNRSHAQSATWRASVARTHPLTAARSDGTRLFLNGEELPTEEGEAGADRENAAGLRRHVKKLIEIY